MSVVRTVGMVMTAVALVTPCYVLAEGPSLTFDNADALKGWTVSGETSVDLTKDRGGVKGLGAEDAMAAGQSKGGTLRLGPGGKAVWRLREQDGTGNVEFWIYEDAAAASKPKTPGAGALWGLMQTNGHMAAVGALYAPYLSGASTYAISTLNPDKDRPWQQVQFLGIRRAPGWHKWTFDFDPDKGMQLRYDGTEVKAFNWNQSKLNGFASVVFFGDATDSGQTLWVDDMNVTLGPPARVVTLWPPPPPTPPAELTVLPPQAPWNPTPYAHWKNGPGEGEDYFPIAVWLQDPKNAARYKAAGINLFLGLYKGPTEEHLVALKDAGMRVICDQNAVGLAHKDDPIIAAWMQPDEPDNAQSFKSYWKEDVATLKEAWPALFGGLGPDQPYRGYGPPIPPSWIVRDYEKARAADPTRPMFLGLGQGVAWEKYIGRGERTGHLEDYAEYIKGCDIACFDIYPAAHDNLQVKDALWYVPLGVRRLREWCKDAKPVWAHIETGIIDAPASVPTPPQVKAEVWMAIIHGARGIDYFVHQFKPQFNEHALLDNPDMLAMVTSVNRQIAELAPVLNSPTLADGVVVESTNSKTPVHAMLKRKNGATYVFAVAMYNEETKARLKINGLTGALKAQVLGEDRIVPAENGVVDDMFAANGVHLYRIAE